MSEKKHSARWLQGAAAAAEVTEGTRAVARRFLRLERCGAATGAVLRPLQVLQRCPASEWLLEAIVAAAGEAGSTRKVLQSCPRHVRRRRGNRAADRSLQLLQRTPAEPGDEGEMLLLWQGTEASRRGEEELPGGSGGTARAWNAEQASAQTCRRQGRQSPWWSSKSG